ncbi:MAG: hypothetical protein U0163_08595 [Gemmatimonadaceae bacterium]
MMGSALWLRLVAAGAALFGVAHFVRPPMRAGAPAPLADRAGAVALPAQGATADSLATEIALANVFSSSRTPPRRRYTPPDSASTQEAPADAPPDSIVSASVPALLGTVVREDGVMLALMQLNPTTAGPRVYRVGDRDGGYRVVAIAPREVVLQGPAGRRVLRLTFSREERP